MFWAHWANGRHALFLAHHLHVLALGGKRRGICAFQAHLRAAFQGWAKGPGSPRTKRCKTLWRIIKLGGVIHVVLARPALRIWRIK